MSTIRGEVRGLRRAAIARGHGPGDGRSTLAPDEDTFTLLASALEAAAVGLRRSSLPVRLVAGAGVSSEVAELLPVLLGVPVEAVRTEPGTGLLRLFEEARRESERESLVVSVADPPHEAAAVAFWIGPGPGGGAVSTDRSESVADAGSGTPDDLRLAQALHRLATERGASSRWVGPWEPTSKEARGAEATGEGGGSGPEAERLRAAVSQGAYVPHARYLENLPSRWRFAADRCGACGAATFPTRGRCRSCRREDRLERVDLPREDLLVVATTVIGRGAQPTEFDAQVDAQGPYAVLLAELAPSVRVTLQATDTPPHAIRIGDRVDTQLRRLYPMDGAWRYGRKAVLRKPRPRRPEPRAS